MRHVLVLFARCCLTLHLTHAQHELACFFDARKSFFNKKTPRGYLKASGSFLIVDTQATLRQWHETVMIEITARWAAGLSLWEREQVQIHFEHNSHLLIAEFDFLRDCLNPFALLQIRFQLL